jgi:hypothetical protein
MSKQDRQGARTPADLEYRYAFGKNFAEVMGIATDARNHAEEAKKVSASVKETTDGLSLKVKDMENQVGGEAALEIKEENGKKYSQLRADVDEIRFDAGDIVINSDKFKLKKDGSAEFSGELKAAKGTFEGDVSTSVEKEVDDLGEKRTKTFSASLSDGILKIVSPAVVNIEGKAYAPLIEVSNGDGQSLVVAIANINGEFSLRLMNGTFFDFNEQGT